MTEGEVRCLEERRWSAMLTADVPALRTLLADDLAFVHSSGKVDSAHSLLSEMSSGTTRYVNLERSEEQVRVFGTFALVHGNAAVRVRSGAVERERRMRYLAVWREHESGPQMVAWQASAMPTPS